MMFSQSALLSAVSIACLFSTPAESRNLKSRIVGGSSVGVNDYPFYAFPNTQRSTGATLCGATLIWNDILVSAAHCGESTWDGGIFLGGNSTNSAINKKTTKYYPTVEMLIHPTYDDERTIDDIMIIKIDGNVTGPFAQLNFDDSLPAAGQELTAIGYGAVREGGETSSSLLKVDFFAVSYEECVKTYKTELINQTMFCNGGIPEGGRDTCQGDSGGPLFLKGTHIQTGIVSTGYGCAQAGVPAINTRVSAFKDWIQQSICQLSSTPPAYCASMDVPPLERKPPTAQPTSQPTRVPTRKPTKKPVAKPTKAPVVKPAKAPIAKVTKAPIALPAPVQCKKIGDRCTTPKECCGLKPKCAGSLIKTCA